jgi:chemotaxis protein MotB
MLAARATASYAPKEEPMESDLETPGSPKKRRIAPWIAVVGVAAAGGLGYVSWTQRDKLRIADHELTQLSNKAKDCSDSLDLLKSSTTDLDVKLTTCKDELTHEKTASAETTEKITVYEAELSTCRSSVKNLEAEAKETKDKLEEFKSLTAKFQKMIDSGSLEVLWRRGKMVVKLPEAILFPSGSADLSDAGRAAMGEVAVILKEMRDRRFTVAGHTDNVPLGKDDRFKSNWELATARALAVLNILIEKGVPPRNLSAAGYGEYDPVAANGTKTGRAKNRRIEIVLEPLLTEALAKADLPK